MVDRRPIQSAPSKSADVAAAAAANGGDDEITINDPLPIRLAELEKRISAALTGARSGHDLVNLLTQCDLAIPQAQEFAKAEQERALDPLLSPLGDAATGQSAAREARQQVEDATFASNRLRTLRPRLLARYNEVIAAEQRQQYLGRYTDLKREGAVLAQELVDLYPSLVGPLVELFGRLRDFQQQCRALHLTDPGDGRPHIIDPELAARGLRAFSADTPSLLECVHLHDWQSGKEIWPPFQPPFAAQFVLPVPQHPGAAWSDPVFQERRRAEIAAEQEKMARHHSQMSKEQEENQNRQLRADWEARQNGRG
jgi:hypothetical protein